MKTWLKAIVISAVAFIGITGGFSYLFRFELYNRERFSSLEELSEHVEGLHGAAGTLWEGTFYIGDQNDSSLFLHKLNVHGISILEIPKDSWNPPFRMTYTKKESEWTQWDVCRPLVKGSDPSPLD